MACAATQFVVGDSFKQLAELLQTLVNQLTDRHLLRLWRTGAKIAVVTAKDDELTDLSPYLTGPEDYALSKDLDVALWIDFRAFHSKPELVDAVDFVIVNSRLHDEFDQFKKAEVQPSYSFLPVVELLLFY